MMKTGKYVNRVGGAADLSTPTSTPRVIPYKALVTVQTNPTTSGIVRSAKKD